MKNKTTLLFSAFAAAALLAGCETTQNNRSARGVFGTGATSAQPSRVRSPRSQPAPVAEQPLVVAQPVAPQPIYHPQPLVHPQPVVPQPVVPQPVVPQQLPAPSQPQVPVAAQPQPVAQPQPQAAPTYATYAVKSGDVAGRIANQHGMKLSEFLEANGMTLEQAGKIRVGQKVKVWSNQEPLKAGPAVQPVASNDPNIHVVKAGETLGTISAKTGVPLATLMKNNNIDNPNLIREGQKLVLRGGTSAPAKPTAPTAPTTQTATPKAPTKAPMVAPTTAPTLAPTATPTKTTKTRTPKTPKTTAETTATPVVPVAPVAVPVAAPVAATPTREPQDASVPNSQVKVDETDASLEDLLSGLSLTEAREQAEEKKETAARQLRDAANGAVSAAADAAPAGYRYYTVKENENIYHLGARFKVPFKTLRELNNLPSNTAKLEAGTRLLVPDVAP